MILRSFERPERTAKSANDTSNRYRMRHMGSQDASASCLVSANDRILGTHKRTPRRPQTHRLAPLAGTSGVSMSPAVPSIGVDAWSLDTLKGAATLTGGW